jgi:hypothetical protein
MGEKWIFGSIYKKPGLAERSSVSPSIAALNHRPADPAEAELIIRLSEQNRYCEGI